MKIHRNFYLGLALLCFVLLLNGCVRSEYIYDSDYHSRYGETSRAINFGEPYHLRHSQDNVLIDVNTVSKHEVYLLFKEVGYNPKRIVCEDVWNERTLWSVDIPAEYTPFVYPFPGMYSETDEKLVRFSSKNGAEISSIGIINASDIFPGEVATLQITYQIDLFDSSDLSKLAEIPLPAGVTGNGEKSVVFSSDNRRALVIFHEKDAGTPVETFLCIDLDKSTVLYSSRITGVNIPSGKLFYIQDALVFEDSGQIKTLDTQYPGKVEPVSLDFRVSLQGTTGTLILLNEVENRENYHLFDPIASQLKWVPINRDGISGSNFVVGTLQETDCYQASYIYYSCVTDTSGPIRSSNYMLPPSEEAMVIRNGILTVFRTANSDSDCHFIDLLQISKEDLEDDPESLRWN